MATALFTLLVVLIVIAWGLHVAYASLPLPIEQRKEECIAAGGTWIAMFGTGYCKMPPGVPLPPEEPEVPDESGNTQLKIALAQVLKSAANSPGKFGPLHCVYTLNLGGQEFQLVFKREVTDINPLWKGHLYYQHNGKQEFLTRVQSEDGIIVEFPDLEFYGFFLGDRFIISETVLEFIKKE